MCEAVGEPARAARWLGARAAGLAAGEADAPYDSRHARELTERLVAAHGEAQVAAWRADGYALDDASVLDTRAAFLAFAECEPAP